MSKLNYEFHIRVYVNGSQCPLMSIGPIGESQHLAHLAHGMANSYIVKKELESITEVLTGNKEVHHFAGDDWCIVSFRKENSLISNGMDSFVAFEIESKLILKLMEDWYAFLLTWENNEIPGIIHPDKRETS